jgi:2-isopropylmalate synthase
MARDERREMESDSWIREDLEFRTTNSGAVVGGVVSNIDEICDSKPRDVVRRRDDKDDDDDEEGEEGRERSNEFLPAITRGGADATPSTVLIYDTTLRDGTQMESISVSCDDKIKITRRLSTFDVDYIEAGWPGSNPKDEEYFRRARTELDDVTFGKLVAFGSTRRKGVNACDDMQVKTLVDSMAPTVCIVAKAHLWQVTDILRADPNENLDMIRDTVSYLVSCGRDVMVDLEHYFDGHAFDKDYAYDCCMAALEGGASVLVLCDTNGGSMPWDVDRIVVETTSRFVGNDAKGGRDNAPIFGIHCHNDCGMAVANSLMAVRAGVGLVQGTINGIGERTGNADLCSIIPSLALHCDVSRMSCRDNLSDVTSLSRYIDETLNRSPNAAAPYVGASAFAHKGGLHVSAIERSPDSYQHVDPSKVGNRLRVLISELSGRQNILGKMRTLDLEDHHDDAVLNERALVILDRVKRLESMGYTFEGADASVELMILHSTMGYCPPFQVLDYTAQVYDTNVDSASRVMSKMERRDVDMASSMKVDPTSPSSSSSSSTSSSSAAPLAMPSSLARATVKVRVLDGVIPHDGPYLDRLEVSEGDGPVDALANALKKALSPSHPELENLHLVDYKVRILDPESATRAATRVMIEFKDVDTGRKWTTVSVDRNIISASLNALVDGFEYALRETVAACVVDFE